MRLAAQTVMATVRLRGPSAAHSNLKLWVQRVVVTWISASAYQLAKAVVAQAWDEKHPTLGDFQANRWKRKRTPAVITTSYALRSSRASNLTLGPGLAAPPGPSSQ